MKSPVNLQIMSVRMLISPVKESNKKHMFQSLQNLWIHCSEIKLLGWFCFLLAWQMATEEK